MRRYWLHRRREVLVDALPDRASADMAPARHELGLALGQLSKPHREAVELLKDRRSLDRLAGLRDAFAISPCARPLPRGQARAISAYQKVGLLSRKCFTVAAREEPLARPERRAAQQNLARDDRREEALGEMAEAVVAVAREAEEIPHPESRHLRVGAVPPSIRMSE